MLNGKELSARIDFCTKDGLGELLDDLAGVHKHNTAHFNEKQRYFFDSVVFSRARLNALAGQLEARLSTAYAVYASKYPKPSPGWISLKYDEPENCLVINMDCTAPVTELNSNAGFVKFATRCVQEIYRYTGDIRIEDDEIPL